MLLYKRKIGATAILLISSTTSTLRVKRSRKDIGPMLETAMGDDQGTFVESQLLIMERHGYPEETYYTFSYSPIPKRHPRDNSPRVRNRPRVICASRATIPAPVARVLVGAHARGLG
jgi:hypothetical protein